MSDIYYSLHDTERKTYSLLKGQPNSHKLTIVSRDLSSVAMVDFLIEALERKAREEKEEAEKEIQERIVLLRQGNHGYVHYSVLKMPYSETCLCGEPPLSPLHVVINQEHMFIPQKENDQLCLCGGTAHNPYHRTLEYFIG